MSRYLVERIAATPNIEILRDTSVTALDGTDGILRDDPLPFPPLRVKKRTCAIRHLFLFIGAEPNTDWLAGSGIALDDKGFIRTGGNVQSPLETSLPGVFAIGDVRSGSVKRVAAAVGEGAQVVAALHAYLSQAGIGRDAGPDRRTVMANECTHQATIRDVTPSALGCEECLKIGSPWVHLRLCRTCGHVGCCDDSPNRHATQHFHATRPSGHRRLRPARGLGLVLCRRGDARSQRARHPA